MATVYVLKNSTRYWSIAGWLDLSRAMTFSGTEAAERHKHQLHSVGGVDDEIEIVKCTLTESVPPRKRPRNAAEAWVDSQKDPL